MNLNDLQKAFAESARFQAKMKESQKAAEERAREEKIKQLMLEMVTKTFDKAAAYTNLVMLGGYAGAFTIWANTKTFLSKDANIWIALLLGSSLCVFVLYEVYKGAVQSNSMSHADALINAKSNPEKFFKQVQQYEKKIMIAVQRERSIWRIIFSFSVLTGLIAVGLLFYNYVALLISPSSLPG